MKLPLVHHTVSQGLMATTYMHRYGENPLLGKKMDMDLPVEPCLDKQHHSSGS